MTLQKPMAPILTKTSYRLLAQLVKARTGIQLEALNRSVVESRLKALAVRNHLDTASLCLAAARGQEALAHQICQEILINETYFFRDPRLFLALRDLVLPERLSLGHGEQIRCWSAACSTGQEPLSLAMLLQEGFPNLKPDLVQILATDIGEKALAQASAGTYNHAEIERGLSPGQKQAHFSEQGVHWVAKAPLRAAIRFSSLNLSAPWPDLGGLFDLVLLRNVLIYFDLDVRRQVLDRVLRRMKPGAYLLLGAGETLTGVHDGFQAAHWENSGCYQAVIRPAYVAQERAA